MPPTYFGLLKLPKSQSKKEVTVLVVAFYFDFDYQEEIVFSECRNREDYAWFYWEVS